MKISLIAAVSKNNVIGVNGAMPWNIPSELKRFKEITTGKVVVMGRKTYEAIGNPLPNRFNIVISKSKEIKGDNCITVSSLKEALEQCEKEKEVFIIGGGEVYKQALPLASKIYLTVIDREYEGDVYFPTVPMEQFKTTHIEKFNEEIPYTCYILEKNRLPLSPLI